MAENNNTLLEKLDGLVARFEEVSTLITDPNVIADQKRYVKLTKEYKDLNDIMKARREYIQCLNGLEEAKQIMTNESDPEMKEMAREEANLCEVRIPELEEEIKLLLVPADPQDDRNAILEIRGGTGGDDAGDIGTHGHRQDNGEGIFILGGVLGQLGGGGHAGNAGDADGGVKVLALGFVHQIHEPAAQQAAHRGDSQGKNPDDQNNDHSGIENGGGLAQHPQDQAQEEGAEIGEALLEQLRVLVDFGLLYGHADEEGQQQGSGYGQQQAEDGTGDDDKQEFGLLRDLGNLNIHVNAAVLFGHHQLDDVGISAVSQA